MSYKELHYYHGTVPQPRCGGTSNAKLLARVATLEASVQELTTANNDLSARLDVLSRAVTSIEQLTRDVVKRSDLVEETHTSFDENDIVIHTLRFKEN